MTRSSSQRKDESSSGVPLLVVGTIAVVFGGVWSHPAVLALGVALVGVPIGVWALTAHGLRGIRVEREAPERAFEGDEIEVRVRLRNSSRVSLFLPRLVATFVPELHERKEVLFPLRVAPGETAEGAYRGQCLLPRGLYTLGPYTVTLSDPFGWFHMRKTVRTPQRLKVYPRFDAFGLQERSGEVGAFVEETLARHRSGESSEFLGVREYRRGDPLRRVHWPLTAHRGFPVVRLNSQPACGDLCIYLDLYRQALVGIGRASSLEHSVKITAALSSHAMRRGHRVQIRAHGEATMSLPLGGDGQRLEALLDMLTAVKPNGEIPLDEVLERTIRDVAPGSTVVLMVSPYVRGSSRFESSLQALRRERVRVILAVFDDDTFRNVYDLDHDSEAAHDYVRRQRSRGVEARVVPCAAHLPTVFRAVR